MRRTPYITQNTQGYSAIVNELYFSDGQGNGSYWIPEESVSEYITYTPQIMAKQNGVTIRPAADAAMIAKVEVPSDASKITYKYRITENGHFYIPTIMPGKEGVRKIVVDVHLDDLMEDGVAYKNGEYLPSGNYGFKTFRTEVRKELPPNPRPEDVFPELHIAENGQINPPTGYIGIKKLKVAVERDKRFTWSDVTMQQMMPLSSCAAVADEDGGLNVFQENRWSRIVGSVIANSVLNFDTTGLSAFIVNNVIHLVGSRSSNGAPIHKVKNESATNPWIDGDVAALPNGIISPNIVQDGDVTYIVGAGASGTGDYATKVYKYEDGVWSEAFDLVDPVYNSMDAAFMYGRIHIWTNNGHVSYDPDTGEITLEEQVYSRLFSSIHYKLVSISTDEVLMVNGGDSHPNVDSSVIYCKRLSDGSYIYKDMGWIPYSRWIGVDQYGFGQNALMVGDELHVFGAEAQRVTTHYKAAWTNFI